LSAINLILGDKQLSQKLTDSAYNYYVNNLTYDKVLPRYVQFYENLIKN